MDKLSKPVAYDYQIAGACIADGHNKNGKWVHWRDELSLECPPDWMIEEGQVKDLKPRYSQEYVSALDDVAQYWIGQSAEWKERAEAADQRIAELEAIATEYAGKFQKAQDAAKHLVIMNDSAQAEIAHLKMLLATPVRLPEGLAQKIKVTGYYEALNEMMDCVRAAGFKCVGDE